VIKYFCQCETEEKANMFQVGQQVIYGIHGVCEITAIEMKTVGKEKKAYYVLEPVDQPGTVFYVPSQNQAAVAKMRTILTRGEFDALLQSEKLREHVWIADENLRKQRYREILSGNDRAELLGMVSALYRHKKEQQECGRKFHVTDENFLRDAQKLLSSEISLVLGITPSEVATYMKKQLEE